MHDQADELRQLIRQRAIRPTVEGPGAPLIVTSGGKGGVGTTATAVNLAVALARQGRRAVFVDADLDHGGNAAFAQEYGAGSIVDILAARRTVHEVMQRGPSGIQVISGHWASGHLSEPSPKALERLIAELKDLAPHADVVVIDGGSSRNQLAQRLWKAADVLLLVTATDRLSVMDTYAAIKAMAPFNAGRPYHLLVNRATNPGLAADVQARIAAACQRFLGLRVEAAGTLPPCAGDDTGNGMLVYPPRCESARALDRLADTLWAQLQLGGRRAARSA